jgi:drug/metabolite transporter (DMT)-like permease
MSAATTATASGAASPSGLSLAQRGALFGLAAAAVWGLMQASARLAVAQGLSPFDLAALRFGGAGLVLLPWLLRQGVHDMAGLGWGKAAAFALLIGPLFFMTNVGGYRFAPLAHGSVLLPATFIIGSSALAAWWLRERIGAARLVGFGFVLGGMVAIAGPGLWTAGSRAWIGDGMFIAAGLMWAGATILVRRWSAGPLQTTAAVAVLSAAVFLPLYLAFGTPQHLLQLSWPVVLGQLIVHGLLAGVGAVLAFTRSVQLLGPARAAVYPALVPAFALLIGVPLTGDGISAAQWLGLVLTTTGLLFAIGVIGLPRRLTRRAA